MRLIAFIEYAAVLIGLVAMIAGQHFALAKGSHLGVFLVGAGIALGGLEGLATRRMPFRPSEDAYEAYAGAPSVIVGAIALLAGAAIVGAAYLLDAGLWHRTVAALSRRPAPVLGAAGLVLGGIGALMMLNPLGRRGLAWTLLVRVPRSLLGLVLLAGGIAGIALGVWEWLEPAAFDDLVRKLPRKLPWPP